MELQSRLFLLPAFLLVDVALCHIIRGKEAHVCICFYVILKINTFSFLNDVLECKMGIIF